MACAIAAFLRYRLTASGKKALDATEV